MDNPLVSIITTLLNTMDYLDKCISSVLSQDYQNIEHFFVDGGSTDGTIEIIKNFIKKKKDINIDIKLVGRKNFCRGSGRNSAIENCKNQFIALIDSGHRANQDWLKFFADILMVNSEIDIIYGSVIPNTEGFLNKIISSFLLGNKKHNGKISKILQNCSKFFLIR